MRIRKHANIPLSPSLSTRTTLHPHVCELNRSPWDVIPFPLQYDGHSHPNPYQREDGEEEEVEEEEAVMGMGNGVSSIAAADGSGEREFSEEEREEKKKKREERGIAAEREMIPSKGKTCNKEEDEGQSQLDACPKVGEKDEVRGRRGRKNQGRAFSSNSDYYYYYSGFGPLWGRKRGGNQLHDVHVPLIPSPSSSPLPSSSDHDDHDHDHDHGHDRRMKRVRKRVKARSLKSLF
ncbi:uncharacterized protein LOC131231682 [Magnolia sinica]|uniref:uncharacterized protein LOC131231682 n=1 Tax=Magnolia sinica TaxID=86752 RepID=UPI002659BB8A|nr:uncharacterized protein LOC131231682 [Magnolia sinica]